MNFDKLINDKIKYMQSLDTKSTAYKLAEETITKLILDKNDQKK